MFIQNGKVKTSEVREVERGKELQCDPKNNATRKCNSVKSCVGRFGKPTRSKKIKNGCGDRCRYKCHKNFPEESKCFEC